MAGVIINNWENGRFVQRNINFDTILEQNKKANKSPVPEVEPDRDGGFGILTQTVVRSPITHWILPARLSNEKDHDVAFIGVSQNYFIWFRTPFSHKLGFIVSFSSVMLFITGMLFSGQVHINKHRLLPLSQLLLLCTDRLRTPM